MLKKSMIVGACARQLIALFLLVVLFVLTGCNPATVSTVSGSVAGATAGAMGAGMGMELLRDLILKKIEGVDSGQTLAAMMPNAHDKIVNSKKVTLQIEGGQDVLANAFGGNPSGMINDSLTVYLMQMGYEVESKDTQRKSDSVENMMHAMQMAAASQIGGEIGEDASKMDQLRDRKVDILVSGSVSSSTKHESSFSHFLGRSGMEMKTKISAASLRITSVVDEKLILTATVAYRHGKNAQEVAADFAKVIELARSGYAL